MQSRPRRSYCPSAKVRENHEQKRLKVFVQASESEEDPTGSVQRDGIAQRGRQSSTTVGDAVEPPSGLPPPPWWASFNDVKRPSHRLHWAHACNWCDCALLSVELNGWCCQKGKWRLSRLPPLPDGWQRAAEAHSPEIGQRSRAINNLFAMSALGVSGGFLHPNGLSNVIVTGRTYHRLLDVRSGNHSLRWFLYDSTGHHRQGAAQRLPEWWITMFKTGLQEVNPFVKKLQDAASHAGEAEFEVTLAHSVANDELAAVLNASNLQSINPRRITYRAKGNDNHQYLSIFSAFYEPLQYPLLFPHGTYGWGTGRRETNLTQIKWYRSRILSEPRFALFSRVAQEYMVDMYSRVEEERINFIRQGRQRQWQRRQASMGTVDGNVTLTETEAWQSSLPSSFLGSRAWCSNQVADSLALCRQFGRPSLFITMTTNPRWPEIEDKLGRGQTASDLPQVVVRVFRAKMKYLIKLLESGSGGFLYLIYVVEFQKRGLPHCHILVKLRHEPSFEAIDGLVLATLPNREEDLQLHEIIFRCNLHPQTHLQNPLSRCNRLGKCQYGFPQQLQPHTSMDEHGRMHLRRLKTEDQWVVSYIPRLSRELNCHIHVDVCSNVNVVMYLYKYLFKGVDYAKARVQERSQMTQAELQVGETTERSSDELTDYVNCRYLSSSEAMYRILGMTITEKRPAVVALSLHLPGRQLGQMSGSRKVASTGSALLYYLGRPIDATFDMIRYADYYARYRRVQVLNNQQMLHAHWKESYCTPEGRDGCWVIEKKKSTQVMRLKIISPSAGELYYLRHLLQCQPGRSFAELRTVDGITHATFQDAATSLGLFKNFKESELALQEAISNWYSPQQLRFLFAQLLIDVPTPALTLWQRHIDHMSLDFLHLPAPQRHKSALIDLARLLQSRGASLKQFGLLSISGRITETEWELEQMDKEMESNKLLYESTAARFNDEQRDLFAVLKRSLESNDAKAYFVDGRAGRGKSFVLQAFVAYCRQKKVLILVVGSTALSVVHYTRGRTAHSAFSIPVNSNEVELTSRIEMGSQRWDFLSNIRVIIWEELPMINRVNFECAQALMAKINEREPNGLMGSCLLITTGDFRQVAPVVKHGGRREVFDASIRSTPYWEKFHVLTLHQPMRSGQDIEFTQWLDDVGDGKVLPILGEDDFIAMESLQRVHGLASACNFVFPADVLERPSDCIERAILSPLNVVVDTHNEWILSLLPGSQVSLFATNWLKEDDNETNHLNRAAVEEYLAAINEAGVPAHELVLKKGAICALTRNLSLEQGLVKNTRVLIEEVGRYTVVVRTLTQGVYSMQRHALPRINFEFVPSWSNYTVCRRQFPLRLAYATTFNSCQGLTLSRVVVDVSHQPFTHGQLYTCLSRVRCSDDIRVLDSTTLIDDDIKMRNIVWRELIL